MDGEEVQQRLESLLRGAAKDKWGGGVRIRFPTYAAVQLEGVTTKANKA